ncbi:MAG TPA: B12-binding domain-containing radical SAM protein [Planctomycetota bacterium]|nr:B12-binding domain-containing radical SAM protein [Planctomycetota bacterium]
MPNVAMVYPEYRTPTFWSFREALKIVKKSANMPPYGLISIAGMLPENFQVSLFDENIRPVTDKDLANADLVMASAMIVQKDSLQDLIHRCNRLGKPIMVGGPIINTCFEDVRDADHYYIGEAEYGFASFIADYLAHSAKKAYGHVVDEIKAERIRAHFGGDVSLIVGERPALNTLPLPRFDLLDHDQYGSMAVQFSRGCPVGCDFCDIWTQYGKRPRTKPVARLIAELDAIRKCGFSGALFIVDDNFIGNKKAVKSELLPELIQWQAAAGYPFRFFTEATITLADDAELLTLMHDAGFDMVFCGIETPDEASLLQANKALNTDRRTHNTAAKLLAQIETVQRAGIEVSTGLILGFDGEPANIDTLMADFIQKAKIPMAMAGLLTALPETDLEKRLAREGRMRGKSAGNNTHGFDMNFEPKRPEADIVASYKRLLSELYDKKLAHYFERCNGLLDRLARHPAVRQKLSFGKLAAVLRSIVKIAPKSYGLNYLKFLARRFIKNRHTFAEAVALGIKGHHLAHITHCAIETHDASAYCDQVLKQLEQYFASVVESYNQGKASVVQSYNEGKASVVESYNQRKASVVESYNQGKASVVESYQQGKARLEEACAKKAAAFRDVKKRIRKLSKASREAARLRYDEFVREVTERFAPIEQLMAHSNTGF